MKRIIVGAAIVLACAYACDSSPQSHVYVASLYEPSQGCFGPSQSLGYVDTGEGDLDCAPTCLVGTSAADGPPPVYVSTMCGPYPSQFDSTQTNATCPAALALWASAGGAGACATGDDAGGDAAEDTGAAGDATSPADTGSPSDDAASDTGETGSAADAGDDAPPGDAAEGG
jgi:hypothetical protein